jgi:hypothetical protein
MNLCATCKKPCKAVKEHCVCYKRSLIKVASGLILLVLRLLFVDGRYKDDISCH